MHASLEKNNSFNFELSVSPPPNSLVSSTKVKKDFSQFLFPKIRFRDVNVKHFVNKMNTGLDERVQGLCFKQILIMVENGGYTASEQQGQIKQTRKVTYVDRHQKLDGQGLLKSLNGVLEASSSSSSSLFIQGELTEHRALLQQCPD